MQFFNTAFLGLVAMTSTSAFSLTPRSSSSVSVSNTVAHMVPLAVVARVEEDKVEVAAEAAAPVAAAATAAATADEVKNTVYVGNLPFSATKEQITNLFTENGVPVLNLAMPTNPAMLDEVTGEPKSKGFAFVDVESEEMIVKAVEALNQINLDGRTMRVNKLLPKEEVAAQKKTRDKNFTPDGKKKLYVGNLPFESSEEDIQKVFAEYGDISDLYLPMRDGRPRGFCFVTMNDDGADKAMAALDGTDFQGRNLVVNEPLKKGEKLAPRASTRPQFKLYVGNLSFYTTHETLHSVFSEFGEVHDCYLPTDPESQQPRGFGFITMEQADGEAAIQELDGLELDGRFIRVNEAQGKRRQSPAAGDESEVAE